MTIKLRSVLHIFIVVILVFSSGCGQKAKEDNHTVTVWHWMSDREDAFQELADKYEEQTGVPVRFDLYAPSESYSQKVKAAAQTNTLPDIFGILGESRDLASFVKSGYIAELSQAASTIDGVPIKEALFDKAISVNEFTEGNPYGVNPGLYGLPLDVTTIQMVYNKDLFAKAGVDPESPPKTWVAFLQVAKKLRENDIPVFVSGFGEIWMLDALSTNFAMNMMGEEMVFDTYRGKVPYTDPNWIAVLRMFDRMADEDIIVSGAVTMVNKTAEQTFANQRAAIAFNGSWAVNVYKGMNPNLNYGAMLPPRPIATNPMKVWGGAGSSFMVNNKSSRKTEAIEFLKWLCSKEQQAFLANATNNLPANKNSLDNINPILAQFADDIDNTTHPNIYPVHESHQVSEAWSKGIQSILIGEKTPEEVAKDVQATKEREMKKARS